MLLLSLSGKDCIKNSRHKKIIKNIKHVCVCVVYVQAHTHICMIRDKRHVAISHFSFMYITFSHIILYL